jgi:hypothetical protein
MLKIPQSLMILMRMEILLSMLTLLYHLLQTLMGMKPLQRHRNPIEILPIKRIMRNKERKTILTKAQSE